MRQITALQKISLFLSLVLTIGFIAGCLTLKNGELDLLDYQWLAEGALERLNINYENEDAFSFMQDIAEDYHAGYLKLKAGIEEEFQDFGDLDLRIIIDNVSIDRDTLFMACHWYKKRRSTATLVLEKIKGKSTFLFRIEKDTSLKLLGIKEDNPFGE